MRIANNATGHVFYCRTHNHSTMGIATGSTPVSTQFDVPSSIETGPSTLVVVANGIASQPWALTVAPPGSISISNVEDAESARTSVTSGQWSAIYGTSLANTKRFWTNSDFTGGTSPGSPLPSTLDGVGVTIGGASGLGVLRQSHPAERAHAIQSAVGARVGCRDEQRCGECGVHHALVQSSPSFFYDGAAGTVYPLAVHLSDGNLVGDPAALSGTEKANPGEILELYANGLAPSPGGVVATVTPFTSAVTVTAGSTSLSVLGAALLYAGEFQVNVQLPSNMPAGNYALSLTVPNGSTSTSGVTVILPVGP